MTPSEQNHALREMLNTSFLILQIINKGYGTPFQYKQQIDRLLLQVVNLDTIINLDLDLPLPLPAAKTHQVVSAPDHVGAGC